MCRDVIIYFEHQHCEIEFTVNLFIVYGKFYIHKCEFAFTSPVFEVFKHEFSRYETLSFNSSKKSYTTLRTFMDFLKESVLICLFSHVCFYFFFMYVFM